MCSNSLVSANMLIDAIDESSRGTAISSTELSIAVDLLSSWQWLSSRPNNISGNQPFEIVPTKTYVLTTAGLMEECFSHEFKEPEFLKACFLCMEWFPRSMYAGVYFFTLSHFCRRLTVRIYHRENCLCSHHWNKISSVLCFFKRARS